MAFRTFLLAGVAASVAVFFIPGDSWAQGKKQPRTGTSTFQQCCEKAYARYETDGRTGTCVTQRDEQKTAFYQCVHNNGVRIKSLGQQSG